eukprot:Nk52_evm14s232 gene=Nk52_evmTU14s232
MPVVVEEGPEYESAAKAVRLVKALEEVWKKIGKCESEVKGPMVPICDMIESVLIIEKENLDSREEKIDSLKSGLRRLFAQLGEDFDLYWEKVEGLSCVRKEDTLRADMPLYEDKITFLAQKIMQAKEKIKKMKIQLGNRNDTNDRSCEKECLKDVLDFYENISSNLYDKVEELNAKIVTIVADIAQMRQVLGLGSDDMSLVYSVDEDKDEVRLFWFGKSLKFDGSEPEADIVDFARDNGLCLQTLFDCLVDNKTLLEDKYASEKKNIENMLAKLKSIIESLGLSADEEWVLKDSDFYLGNNEEKEALQNKLVIAESIVQEKFKEEVDALLQRLKVLWGQTQTPEERQQEFLDGIDVYSLGGISAMKAEVGELELIAEDCEKILKLIDKRCGIISEMCEFEVKASDPKRLFASSIQLLKEEKFRRTAYPSLVKQEKKLIAALQEYEQKHGKHFLIHGEVYINTINREISHRCLDAEVFGIAYNKTSADTTPTPNSPHVVLKENCSPSQIGTGSVHRLGSSERKPLGEHAKWNSSPKADSAHNSKTKKKLTYSKALPSAAPKSTEGKTDITTSSLATPPAVD